MRHGPVRHRGVRSIWLCLPLALVLAAGAGACSRQTQEQRTEDMSGLHNQLFNEGAALIKPYMQLHEVVPESAEGERARRDITEGIERLRAVIAINPKNWAAHWMIGKGYQALGQRESAYAAFKASWDIHKENPDVAREYMLECLELGRTQEAVAVAAEAMKLAPNDPGLRANHALSLLMNGEIESAHAEAQAALAKDPNDAITQSLAVVIDEVRSGKRPKPRSMAELTGGK